MFDGGVLGIDAALCAALLAGMCMAAWFYRVRADAAYVTRPLVRVPVHLAVVLQDGSEVCKAEIARVLHWSAEREIPIVTLYHMTDGVLQGLNLIPPPATLDGKPFKLNYTSGGDSHRAFDAAVKRAPARRQITEEYIDDAIAAFKDLPDPELMIVFGRARCVYGFPAWPISVTEMTFHGSIRGYTYGTFLKDLHLFADTKVVKGV